jgi:hypothetical protein
MDSKRFDSFTRALARWSSRRTFLGGLSAVAVGGSLPLSTRAAVDLTPFPEECGVASDTGVRGMIAQISSEALQMMALPGEFAANPHDKHENDVQFEDYVARVRCLLAHGEQADEQNLDGDGIRFLIDMADGLVSAVSIGAADSLVLAPDDATPTASDHDVQTSGCISEHMKTALRCKFLYPGNDPEDDVARFTCFTDFFLNLIGPPGADSCLKQTVKNCHRHHGCCLRGCCPTFC